MAKSKSSSALVWIAAGLLLVGAFGFGATGLSGSVRKIGTVGDVDISAADYRFRLRQELLSRSAQLNTNLTFADATALGLPDAVLRGMIAARVLDNEAVQLGLSVGDEAVREAVLADGAFIGPSGTFDRDIYAELLAQNGLTETDYETALRDEAARTLLQAGIASGLPQPDLLARALALYIAETRDFTWAVLGADVLDAPVPTPTEDALRAYYDANPDAFTSPETRAVTYAWLSPEMLQDEIDIPESELRALYDERIDTYVQPERRLVERLVFPSEEAAADALAQIEAGETDFDSLVEARGLALEDVDIGDQSEAELGDAGPAVFSVDPGTVVGPFASEFGPALFRMNAILSAQEITFDEVRDDLFDERAEGTARRLIGGEAERINDLLASGATLEDLAENSAMELGTLEMNDETTDGLAAYAEVREKIAATEPGDYPELFDLEDGGVVALRVDELRAPALRDFDAVRDRVAELWTEQATRDAIRARAAALAEEIAPGTEFTDLGLVSAVAERGLTRRDFLIDTPPDFLATVFDMEPGETRVVDTATGAIVVRLDAVNAADPEDPGVAAEADSIAATAAAGIAQDLLVMYGNAVQQRTEIKLDEAAINAVNGSFQ